MTVKQSPKINNLQLMDGSNFPLVQCENCYCWRCVFVEIKVLWTIGEI